MSCKHLLLKGKTDDRNVKCEVFLHFKLYKHCIDESLHRPSDVVMNLLTVCYNKFIENFDSVKHTTAVFSKLHDSCVTKLNEVCEDVGFHSSCGSCMKDTLNKCIVLFLKVVLHHKVKVITRTLLETTKQSRKNRKAMKVTHK